MLELINILKTGLQGIMNWQVVVLIFICAFWLLLASFQDLKKREVENWWAFSLVALVLGFRAFCSVYDWNIWPIAWGLIGLIFGFAIANLFYYARMFAAGDFKLLIAVFSIIPLSCLSFDWKTNLLLACAFLVLLILAGAFYGLLFIIYLTFRNFRNFKREFPRQFKKYRRYFFFGIVFFIILLVIGFLFEIIFMYLGLIILIASSLLIYSKTIEESCMIRNVKVRDLTIGDWLVFSVKAGNKLIKPDWEGLSEKNLKIIQSKLNGNARVVVKEGIPFVPAFLVALLILMYFII